MSSTLEDAFGTDKKATVESFCTSQKGKRCRKSMWTWFGSKAIILCLDLIASIKSDWLDGREAHRHSPA